MDYTGRQYGDREHAGREYGARYSGREFRGREYGPEKDYEGFGRYPYQAEYAETTIRSGASRGSRENAILVRLSDIDFDIPDRDDVRGRSVIDLHGNDIGNVDDLIVDQQQRRVCFLQVISGGFLGFGGTMLLVPVEAITRVTNKIVAIDQRSPTGFRTAAYNPTLIDRRTARDEYRAYDRGYGAYSDVRQHRGRGPRGYRRSDERIREDINDRLSDRGDLDATDIEVMVVNAEVTLSGTVNSRRDKRLAEDIAEDVSGVQNVENRLRVNRLGSGTSTDRYDVTAAPGSTGRLNSEPASESAQAKSTSK